jgi:hypothetical protein
VPFVLLGGPAAVGDDARSGHAGLCDAAAFLASETVIEKVRRRRLQ